MMAFAPIALLKRVMRANHSVALYKKSDKRDLHFEKNELHFCSLDFKTPANRREIQRANFQTWLEDVRFKLRTPVIIRAAVYS